MDAMDFGNESDDEPISTEMLENIFGGSPYHLNMNRRESRYKICDCVKQIQSEWKGALKATQNMGKGLHKVFITVVKDISQELTPLDESGSEFSYFVPDPRKSAEVAKFSDDIKKPWLKATQTGIKNLINNQTFLVEDPKKGKPVTSLMDNYQGNIQSDGSLFKSN